MRTRAVLIVIAVALTIIASVGASSMGINYGRVVDNIRSYSKVVQLIKRQGINKLKIYDADSANLHEFSGTDIKITISIPNEKISNVSRHLSQAYAWVQQNVVAYFLGTHIMAITVGNEAFANSSILTSYLVSTMTNIHSALVKYNLDEIVKVSSPVATSALQNSFPPLSSVLKSDLVETMINPMLDFLSQTGPYLMVNAYPFFAYKGDTNDISLDYAFFSPSARVWDNNTRLLYTNLFDEHLDAVFSAMSALGYKNLYIVVSEIGWPSKGYEDETSASFDKVMVYNGNLVKHVLSNSRTSLRHKASLDTFISSLFNENKKPGLTLE